MTFPLISSISATGRLKSTGLILASGKRMQTEKKELFSHLLNFFFSARGFAGVGFAIPGHLLNHISPLPMMTVARKINKQKEPNSICRTATIVNHTWSEYKQLWRVKAASLCSAMWATGPSAWRCATHRVCHTELAPGTRDSGHPFPSAGHLPEYGMHGQGIGTGSWD